MGRRFKKNFKSCTRKVKANTVEEKELEFGDVLFSLINYSRFIDLDPEAALEKTNKKFMKRFQYLEKKSEILRPRPARYEPRRNGCDLGGSEVNVRIRHRCAPSDRCGNVVISQFGDVEMR